jgi:hypothetical protein
MLSILTCLRSLLLDVPEGKNSSQSIKPPTQKKKKTFQSKFAFQTLATGELSKIFFLVQQLTPLCKRHTTV